MTKVISPKKLIEVALPLDDINAAAAREKSIRHGHPSTLHLWWARRPLAAARAVIFAQMVIDPSETVQGDKRLRETQLKISNEREKLFDIIRELVRWENTNNEEVLNKAREAIKESWLFTCSLNKKHPQADELFNPEKLPAFHDPFAGGGSIPLEAQRLGMESYASDLNPVPVTINKAMIEALSRFNRIPILDAKSSTPLLDEETPYCKRSRFAKNVEFYSESLKEKVYRQISSYYPEILIDDDRCRDREDLGALKGKKVKVIAWLWARTVDSPSPAYSGCKSPLVSSFVLNKKKGREAYVVPSIEGQKCRFIVKRGGFDSTLVSGTKVGRGGNFSCIFSGSSIPVSYIRNQGKVGRMGRTLLAIVVETPYGQNFLTATEADETIADSCPETWRPEVEINHNPRDIRTQLYGLTSYADLFSKRQLLALNSFLDAITSIREQIISDCKNAGVDDDQVPFENGGTGAQAFADAVCLFLNLGLGRSVNYWSSLTAWGGGFIVQTFGRQALPMVWDYAEVNPFSDSTGNWSGAVDWILRVIETALVDHPLGHASQQDAQTQTLSVNKVVSTDPPYYDNICYADLSDYFYVWLRKGLKPIFPELYRTITVPKTEELVASKHRFDSKETAESFFVEGMKQAMRQICLQSHPGVPITIYYAFRQSETSSKGTANTGWESFLEAVIQSGFSIVGTWPMRTERDQGLKTGANFLASSIVLVCNQRTQNSGVISRRDFQRALRSEMPDALEAMIGGKSGQSPIAPVDLAQAAIGPGMAIYSKYEAVLNQDGSSMSVHDSLLLINRCISEHLNPDRGSFDSDTLFCDDWFSQYGWRAGPYGDADLLSKAKGTSVDGVKDAGVIESGGGKVRLLKWSEYPTDWDPKTDSRTPVWEACHQMIRMLNQQGEAEAGALLTRMPEHGEHIRQLAYHLYTLCERKKWAEEARAYNELIGSWHAIAVASHEVGHRGTQSELGLDF